MKNRISLILPLILILILVNLVSAIPGIPHQFYGNVIVNGKPVPDNNILIASIDGDDYTTVTQDGKYGFAPNIFYVEDPDGDRAGKTISFYLGGKDVGSATFENNGFTNLDISTLTSCGDSYCLGEETCGTCSEDCGICTNPPVIIIDSPENGKSYNTTKIELIVRSDQEIIVWMYSLNSEPLITFSPNITLTAREGENNISVVGINQNFQSGSTYVEFIVELPQICGDGVCDAGETCSSCPADCGACSNSNNAGGGGGGEGGGGGGGGGGGNVKSSDSTGEHKTSNVSKAYASINLTIGQRGNETEEPELKEPTEETRGLAGIVGAVTGTLGKAGMTGAILFIVIILAALMTLTIVKRKKKEKARKRDI